VTLAVTGNTISGRVFRRHRVSIYQGHRVPLTGNRRDIRLVSYSGKTPTFCVFPVFSVAVMEKCCDACGDGEYYFRSGFSTSQGESVSGASSAVDRKSMGHTVGELQWKDPDFLCISLYLAWRLWKSVVTLAVTGNTISGRVFRRHRVTDFQGHRVPLTGSRRDIRLVSYSGKTPTFCVFPVFSVAVMEKCCDACGDGEYYFRSGFSTSQGDGVSGASSAVDRKSMGHTVGELQWKDPDFLCISLYLAWRLWKSVVTLAVTGNTISGRVFRRHRVSMYQEASSAVDRKSTGHTVGELQWKDPDFLCIFCI
jgi:nitrate reductase NapE component